MHDARQLYRKAIVAADAGDKQGGNHVHITEITE
jgi:hypothetical protein